MKEDYEDNLEINKIKDAKYSVSWMALSKQIKPAWSKVQIFNNIFYQTFFGF